MPKPLLPASGMRQGFTWNRAGGARDALPRLDMQKQTEKLWTEQGLARHFSHARCQRSCCSFGPVSAGSSHIAHSGRQRACRMGNFRPFKALFSAAGARLPKPSRKAAGGGLTYE